MYEIKPYINPGIQTGHSLWGHHLFKPKYQWLPASAICIVYMYNLHVSVKGYQERVFHLKKKL